MLECHHEGCYLCSILLFCKGDGEMKWIIASLMIGVVTSAYAGSESSQIYVLAIRDVKPV
jgi:hypothetical protein